MNDLLLILVLLTDPASRPTAEALAVRLADQGVTAKVVIGPEAYAILKERGVADADLTTQPAVGTALTGKDLKIAVVRLDRQERGGNLVVEARVWAGGHQDRQVAISGKLALTANPAKPDEPPTMQLQDPQDNTVRGVVAMLAPWLAAGGKSPATDTESQLATSAEAKEWMKIVVLTDNLDKPTPRQRYYRILALVHTDRRPEAETAVAAFRAEKPNHVLLNALDDLLAPVVKPYPEPHEPDINNATPVDDGGNVLR